MYMIAHLSDSHLDGGDAARSRFERVMAYLDNLPTPVDLLILTGDLIEGGAVAEYQVIAEAVAGNTPALFCPGNSDPRDPFRAALQSRQTAHDAPAAAPVNSARTFGALTVIMLDSSVPGQYHGALDAETIDWLDATLAEMPGDMPVLIGMHHPPVELGHPGVDQLRLLDAAPLAATLQRYPNVAAVLVGHTHTATATTFAGRPLLVAPGIHSSLRLPWEKAAPGQSLLDETASPALAIHLLHDDARITTYYRTIG
jgi:Icc protein